MFLVRGLLTFMRTLSRILNRKHADDRENIRQTIFLARFQQHSSQTQINRYARYISTEPSNLLSLIHRLKLKQQMISVVYLPLIRLFDKRKLCNIAQFKHQHLQYDGSEVGTQNFWRGELSS